MNWSEIEPDSDTLYDQADRYAKTIEEEEERKGLEKRKESNKFCFSFIQDHIIRDLAQEKELLKDNIMQVNEDIMRYIPLQTCCLSPQDNGFDNIFTSRLIPYCLASLRYKKTQHVRYYCIWETLVNINFILAYCIFFAIHIIIAVTYLIWELFTQIFEILIDLLFGLPEENKYNNVVNVDLITYYRNKCQKNAKYIVIMPLFLIFYICILIVSIIVILVLVLVALVCTILVIIIGIIVEVLLSILLVLAFIIWNILTCFYPISYAIFALMCSDKN